MGSVAYCWGGVSWTIIRFFEIPKKRIGIRPPDLIQRIVLFVEDTKMSKIEHWLILQFGRLA